MTLYLCNAVRTRDRVHQGSVACDPNAIRAVKIEAARVHGTASLRVTDCLGDTWVCDEITEDEAVADEYTELFGVVRS